MNKEKYLLLSKEKSVELINNALDLYNQNKNIEASMYIQELEEILRDLKDNFKDEI